MTADRGLADAVLAAAALLEHQALLHGCRYEPLHEFECAGEALAQVDALRKIAWRALSTDEMPLRASWYPDVPADATLSNGNPRTWVSMGDQAEAARAWVQETHAKATTPAGGLVTADVKINSNDVHRLIAHNLQRRRQYAGLTIAALNERMIDATGMSFPPSTWSDLEGWTRPAAIRRRRFSAFDLVAICATLDCKVVDLLAPCVEVDVVVTSFVASCLDSPPLHPRQVDPEDRYRVGRSLGTTIYRGSADQPVGWFPERSSSGTIRRCVAEWSGPVKAVTLHQPWASLIAVGIKTVETRSWGTRHRGPLAIHAGQRPMDNATRRWALDALDGHPLPDGVPWGVWLSTLPHGAVLATCQLVEVLPTALALDEHPDQDPWGDFGPDRFGWVLADVRRLPEPRFIGGRQGLWTLDLQEVAR